MLLNPPDVIIKTMETKCMCMERRIKCLLQYKVYSEPFNLMRVSLLVGKP